MVENQLFVCKDQLLRDISIVTCRVTIWRLMIWILHSIISARKHYFQGQKEGLLGKEKSSKDCQLAELNEEILKINTKAMLLKSTISELWKSIDKAFLDAQKKTNLLKGEMKLRRPLHWKEKPLGNSKIWTNPMPKRKVLLREKRFITSDKIFSSVNLFLLLFS